MLDELKFQLNFVFSPSKNFCELIKSLLSTITK